MLQKYCSNTYLWEEPLDFLSSFCSLGVVRLLHLSSVFEPRCRHVAEETDAGKQNLSRMWILWSLVPLPVLQCACEPGCPPKHRHGRGCHFKVTSFGVLGRPGCGLNLCLDCAVSDGGVSSDQLSW